MTHASAHAWFNGQVTDREAGAPSIASVNFHLGTSVFDGLFAYWNTDHYYLHRAEEHLVRFKRGAASMGLEFEWSVNQLTRGIHELLEREPRGDQYIRPIAYRRAPELWVTGGAGKPVDVSIFAVRVHREFNTPVTCHLSPVERISHRSVPGQTKVSGAYVNSFKARRAAEAAGFQDGIMLDRSGRVAEASAANIFLIADGCTLTPRLGTDVFPGITRLVVLELARTLGVEVLETDLWPDDVRRASGAFLCSTLMELRGVSRIDECPLSTFEHPIYRSIVDAFRSMTANG